MSLSAQDILKAVRTRGLRWAVISALSTVALGVVDQFTSRIIPAVAQYIDYKWNPPQFFIHFAMPIQPSVAITVAPFGIDVRPVEVKPAGRGYVALSRPGSYELRLRRTKDHVEQELVDAKAIEKRDEIWTVDTSDRYWASVADLQKIGSTATRWSVVQEDYALIGSAEGFALRAIIASALVEVGISSDGAEAEKLRVGSYLIAAGRKTRPDPQSGLYSLWGAAFMAWPVKQAGLEPPQGAESFGSWLAWGDKVEPTAAGPGMIAVFRPRSIEGRRGGIVMRRHPECIEVVAGNVVERVVITCLPIERLEAVRRPSIK